MKAAMCVLVVTGLLSISFTRAPRTSAVPTEESELSIAVTSVVPYASARSFQSDTVVYLSLADREELLNIKGVRDIGQPTCVFEFDIRNNLGQPLLIDSTSVSKALLSPRTWTAADGTVWKSLRTNPMPMESWDSFSLYVPAKSSRHFTVRVPMVVLTFGDRDGAIAAKDCPKSLNYELRSGSTIKVRLIKDGVVKDPVGYPVTGKGVATVETETP